jgi:hypothetical protein
MGQVNEGVGAVDLLQLEVDYMRGFLEQLAMHERVQIRTLLAGASSMPHRLDDEVEAGGGWLLGFACAASLVSTAAITACEPQLTRTKPTLSLTLSPQCTQLVAVNLIHSDSHHGPDALGLDDLLLAGHPGQLAFVAHGRCSVAIVPCGATATLLLRMSWNNEDGTGAVPLSD